MISKTSKKLILIGLFVSAITTPRVNGQTSTGTDAYKKLIFEDLEVLNLLYSNQLFFTILEDFNGDLIQITNVDTVSTGIASGVYGRIIKISFKSSYCFFINNGILSDKEFDIYVYSYGRTFYRLFGFYSSDIRFLIENEQHDVLTLLKLQIVESKLLSKRQARKYIRIVKGDKDSTPGSLMLNSVILEEVFSTYNYISQDKANTVLLQRVKQLRTGGS